MSRVTYATLAEALEKSPRCHECGDPIARCEWCGTSATEHDKSGCWICVPRTPPYFYTDSDLYSRGDGEDREDRWLCPACAPIPDPECRCGRPVSACICP